MNCNHDIDEINVAAIDDNYCPLCLLKRIEKLEIDCSIRENALYQIREKFPDHEASKIAGQGLTVGKHEELRNCLLIGRITKEYLDKLEDLKEQLDL